EVVAPVGALEGEQRAGDDLHLAARVLIAPAVVFDGEVQRLLQLGQVERRDRRPLRAGAPVVGLVEGLPDAHAALEGIAYLYDGAGGGERAVEVAAVERRSAQADLERARRRGHH